MSSKNRILDRNLYSQKTLSVFGILGSYIVDIYYNHLYAEAIKFKNAGQVASITEGYKHAVYAFFSVIDTSATQYNSKHYTNLLSGINKSFITYSSFSTLTISDCIDQIVNEFVPADFIQALTKDEKRNIIRKILINSMKEFSRASTTEFLGPIIDNHSEPANIEALQDKMTDILILERESWYHKFINANDTEKVDKGLAVKMQQEIKKYVTEKMKMLAHISELEKQLMIKTQLAHQLVDKYKMLHGKYQSAMQELQSFKDQSEVPPEPFYGSPFRTATRYDANRQSEPVVAPSITSQYDQPKPTKQELGRAPINYVEEPAEPNMDTDESEPVPRPDPKLPAKKVIKTKKIEPVKPKKTVKPIVEPQVEEHTESINMAVEASVSEPPKPESLKAQPAPEPESPTVDAMESLINEHMLSPQKNNTHEIDGY